MQNDIVMQRTLKASIHWLSHNKYLEAHGSCTAAANRHRSRLDRGMTTASSAAVPVQISRNKAGKD